MTLKQLLLLTATAAAGLGAVSAAQAQQAVGTAPADSYAANADARDIRIVELERRLTALAEEMAALRGETAASLKKVETSQSTLPKISWKGAPEFSGGPDGASFKVRGRALVDGVFQNWDAGVAGVPDLDVREFRARQLFIGVEGKINRQWAYKIEGGWANGGTPTWDDAILEFRPNDNTAIIFGNAKAAGLENLTSTRFVTFMERGPYANVAALDYNAGIIARHWGKNWSITGAVQGDSINTGDVPGEETLSGVVRATYAPVLTDTTQVHLGVWARRRSHGDGSAFSYTPRPNTAYVPGGAYALKGTGAVGDTDTTLGLEGLAIHRRFSLQGEYVHIAYDGFAPAPDGDIDAGYLMGSWFIGGNRTYSASGGDVGRPKIDRAMGKGGWGALELAARYDFVDIEGSLAAGEYGGVSLGANYYPNAYTRFMLNYTNGSQSNPLTADDIEVQALQMRAQLDF